MFVYLYTDYFFNPFNLMGPIPIICHWWNTSTYARGAPGALAWVRSWWLHASIGSRGDRRRRRASPAGDHRRRRASPRASHEIVKCVPADRHRAPPCDRRRAAQLESSHVSPGILFLYMHVDRKNLLPFLFFSQWLNLYRVQAAAGVRGRVFR